MRFAPIRTARPTQMAGEGGLKLYEQKNLATTHQNWQRKQIVMGPRTRLFATVIEPKIYCGQFDKTLFFSRFRHLGEILSLYYPVADHWLGTDDDKISV